MSRIGNKPIILEAGISIVSQTDGIVVTGPKGSITVLPIPGVRMEQKDNSVTIHTTDTDSDSSRIGLMRSLLHNAVIGVSKGWTKTLELVGVGFRAQTQGNDVVLHVGFSHPVTVNAPSGITFSIVENKITVSGPDKYVVGEVAATIKRIKPPEPYKGKGIRYLGEVIRKKLGKAAKAVGGAPGAK